MSIMESKMDDFMESGNQKFNYIEELEIKLSDIKKQFIKYESSDHEGLDMMLEYVKLQNLIMSIKE